MRSQLDTIQLHLFEQIQAFRSKAILLKTRYNWRPGNWISLWHLFKQVPCIFNPGILTQCSYNSRPADNIFTWSQWIISMQHESFFVCCKLWSWNSKKHTFCQAFCQTVSVHPQPRCFLCKLKPSTSHSKKQNLYNPLDQKDFLHDQLDILFVSLTISSFLVLYSAYATNPYRWCNIEIVFLLWFTGGDDIHRFYSYF